MSVCFPLKMDVTGDTPDSHYETRANSHGAIRDEKADAESKIDIILRDFKNIDMVLGLNVSSRYYLARKL